jgi:hypothetical protein
MKPKKPHDDGRGVLHGWGREAEDRWERGHDDSLAHGARVSLRTWAASLSARDRASIRAPAIYRRRIVEDRAAQHEVGRAVETPRGGKWHGLTVRRVCEHEKVPDDPAR